MLIVKKSRIPNSGKGLFTTSRIRKGDVIIEYKGEKMTWEQCLKRYDKNMNEANYLYFVSKNNCVDAKRTTNELARYANDANGFTRVKGLTNNAEYDNLKTRPYIVANKNIPAGSEIFVDYTKGYWDEMEKEMKKKKK